MTRPAWRQNANRSAASRGYGKDHQRWRAAVLALYPTCNEPSCNKPSTDADHIKPIAKGGARYDLNNGQGLCAEHHKQKTQLDSHRSNKRPSEAHPGMVSA